MAVVHVLIERISRDARFRRVGSDGAARGIGPASDRAGVWGRSPTLSIRKFKQKEEDAEQEKGESKLVRVACLLAAGDSKGNGSGYQSTGKGLAEHFGVESAL